MYIYEVNAYDVMMSKPVTSRCESDVKLTKEDLVKKWDLNSPDITNCKVYEIVDGRRVIIF